MQHHLWRKILGGAAERRGLVCGGAHEFGQPKVGQLAVAYLVQKNVLRLCNVIIASCVMGAKERIRERSAKHTRGWG